MLGRLPSEVAAVPFEEALCLIACRALRTEEQQEELEWLQLDTAAQRDRLGL